MASAPHYPVMLNEVLQALSPIPGGCIVDGTLGAGGYSRAILDQGPQRLFSFDRDASAFSLWDQLHGDKPEALTFVHSPFGAMKAQLTALGVDQVDGIVLDLGVSSMQLDQAQRGFSFAKDGPLDMRMDQSRGETAADVVNTYEQQAIADILWRYGEERKSRHIAQAIVKRRAERLFENTLDLADLIKQVVRQKPGTKIHAATRSFQALRIHVNDELGELHRALDAALDLLSDQGRLVVVSFHSLEDRIVKQFLRGHSGKVDQGSRHMPFAPTTDAQPAAFKALSNKVIKPTAKECDENPRSRSALMRAAVRLRPSPHSAFPSNGDQPS